VTVPALHAETGRQAALEVLSVAFGAVGIDAPRREARLVMIAALDIDSAELLARPDAALGPHAHRLVETALRRMRREPLSRILGRREFFGLELAIGPEVLDPRPETEILVEAVLDHAARVGLHARPVRVLDIGTGSGAILAAILAGLPLARGVATDLSQAALTYAVSNFERLGLAGRVQVLRSDWFASVEGDFDIVVSNPPYIASGAVPGLDAEVRHYDPLLALDGGVDGLAAYRAIASGLASHLSREGFAALELGAGQARAVARAFSDAGFPTLDVRRDLAGIERVLMVHR